MSTKWRFETMWLVATEDELSEAVARRLLEETGANTDTATFLRRNGYGYLKSKIDGFCKMTARPILMVTDLDTTDCPPTLIQSWFGQRTRPQNFIFRVAVREVEAWLLADREGMASFLNVPAARIERNPEALSDPKRYLLKLAEKAPRELRNDLLPRKGAASSQGFGYNSRLGRFVADGWSAQRAATASDSLTRARERLRQCAVLFSGEVRTGNARGENA